MSLTPRLVALMVMSIALCLTADAEAQNIQNTQNPQNPQNTKNKAQAARPVVPTETALRTRINEWTVGLAGGLLEGAPIRLATEISRVVNDGENLHVLPIVTRGDRKSVV